MGWGWGGGNPPHSQKPKYKVYGHPSLLQFLILRSSSSSSDPQIMWNSGIYYWEKPMCKWACMVQTWRYIVYLMIKEYSEILISVLYLDFALANPASYIYFLLLLLFFFFFTSTPAAYGSSQARIESELQLPAYLTANSNAGSLATEQSQRPNPNPHGHCVDFLTCWATTGTLPASFIHHKSWFLLS